MSLNELKKLVENLAINPDYIAKHQELSDLWTFVNLTATFLLLQENSVTDLDPNILMKFLKENGIRME